MKGFSAKKLCLIWIYFISQAKEKTVSGEQKLRHKEGGEKDSPLLKPM